MKKLDKYTAEELAEAFIFPVKLTKKQEKEAVEQLAAARRESQAKMTDNDRMTMNLFQLKFQLEDYLNEKKYDPEKNFGYFLKRYIDILNVKRKAFAGDISIDETLLSQMVHMRRTPPDYITIRLELHSNNIIPADYWIRLIDKHKEYEIRTDKKLRSKERKFVHSLPVSI